jgi:cell division protein FtsI/penicillin-binding protein 2
MGGLAGAGLLALGGRLAQLQLVEAQRYQKLSAGNQFNYRLVPPPRGLILDRNGTPLASNRPNFRLMVTKDKDLDVEATLDDLAKLVPIDGSRRARIIKDLARAPRKAPVAVMEDMTWEEFSRVNIRAPELPAVTADMGEVRVYPFGGAFAHVIGYVAKVSDRDLERPRTTRPRTRICCTTRASGSASRASRKPSTPSCAAGPAPPRPRSTPRAGWCAWTPRATSADPGQGNPPHPGRRHPEPRP